MRTYSLDDLLDSLHEELTFASRQTMRRKVVELLRTQLWRRIGYDLVGVRTRYQLPVGRDGYVTLPDELLAVDDASADGERYNAVTTALLGKETALYMQRDPVGISFPYYTGSHIWLQGYSLPTDVDGQMLIPQACFAAAQTLCLSHLLARLPAHPRFGERGRLDSMLPGLLGEARAELRNLTAAAQDRAESHYFGSAQEGYWP